MTAPERICLLPDDGWSWVKGPKPPHEENAIEYVRADIAAVPEQDECGHPFCGAKCGTGPVIAIEPQPDPRDAVIARLVDALGNLLEATTAEDRFHDRSLTITGPTYNLKWLLEAEEDARAAIAAAKAVQK